MSKDGIGNAEVGKGQESSTLTSKVGAALVVGAGIAGIQSALEMAEAGFKVYLLDRAPAIGGVMAMLDKTFPTNDCSMCILAPKLVGTGRHPNIEIISGAELVSLEGEPGNFTARVVKRPRYVILDKCTGCLDCTKVCPVQVPDTYNQGLSKRRAVYKLFAQAIPNAVAIDKNEHRAPCRLACPAGVNAQGYVALIRERKFKEGYELVRERLPFVGICGRVCHHPCEEKCNRKDVEEPVAIRTLKRFLADWALKNGPIPYKVEGGMRNAEKGERVAVIGSGPAGLTCALDLRLKGYSVTVFEASEAPGGMMRWGIPMYRLPREVLDSEVQAILDTGVELKLNSPINTTDELKGLLRNGYKAVFVALGCSRSRTLKIPGMELQGVLHGIEFLREVNSGTGQQPNFSNKRVVVIGGGNVAVDCALCARRLGAQEVTMVCLERLEEMPAHKWEIEEAVLEGVKIMPSWGPKAIKGENGQVAGLDTVYCTSVFDEHHRFNPRFDEEKTGFVPSEVIILAIGQEVAGDGFEGIERGPLATFKVDPVTLMVPGMPGVFAGGDARRGPASVIEAVADGHEAAISIDRFIRGEDLAAGRPEPKPEPATLEESGAARSEIKKTPRLREPALEVAKRESNFQEINLGFEEEDAVKEARRCLDCGVCSECFQCVAACEAKAIDHTDTVQEIKLKVGAVVLAGGFKEFKPLSAEWGYGKLPNVVTALEFERILSATGPYQGQVCRPGDGKPPKKIAWIQCVGSRSQERYYCSSVCCMFATKEAVIAQEHCGGDLECHIYYIDMRCFGKGFERYYERARKEYGVVYRRCRVAKVTQSPDDSQNLIVTYEDEEGRLQDEVYDLVVLSSAMVADLEFARLCERLGVAVDEQGFIRTDDLYPVVTSRPGVFACGTLVEPKDIPETVTEATGCAGAVAGLLSEARNTLVKRKEYPPQRDVSLEEPRVGVFICNCGINIGGVVRVPEVVEFAKTLPGVVYAEENLFTCSQDTQEKIRRVIAEQRLNRVVVASCTPRTHEPLFQETMAEAGLNPYLFTMANIRDQCSWVHMHIPEEATEKAKDLVRMAVANARRLKPLMPTVVPVVQKALVIGGGLAGMTAALSIAEQGFEVFLVEREKVLGGKLRRIRYNEKGERIENILTRLERNVQTHPKIKVFLGSEVKEVAGYVGNYKSTIQPTADSRPNRAPDSGRQPTVTIEHGVFVVATGAIEYQPKEFLYGEDERVKTQLELEEMIESGSEALKFAKTIAMVQCVGSRDEKHPYCSRICCTEAIKNAIRLKKEDPKRQVVIFYRDIRTYGFKEALYQKARQSGVIFIRFDPEDEVRSLKFERRNGRLHLAAFDPVLGRRVGVDADLLVLSTGVVFNPANRELAQLLKVPLNEDGFFLEAHLKLRPVDFNTAGVFMAGLCHSPRLIDETIAQALAAAARAGGVIGQKEITTQGVVARVKERWCAGCGVCERVCQYEAVRLNPAKGKSEVTAVLCQGCGACAAACPSNAIELQGFESRQLLSMIEAAL